MDIHGHDENGNIFGEPPSTVWGTATDADGWGNRPSDVFGNEGMDIGDTDSDVFETMFDLLTGLFGG